MDSLPEGPRGFFVARGDEAEYSPCWTRPLIASVRARAGGLVAAAGEWGSLADRVGPAPYYSRRLPRRAREAGGDGRRAGDLVASPSLDWTMRGGRCTDGSCGGCGSTKSAGSVDRGMLVPGRCRCRDRYGRKRAEGWDGYALGGDENGEVVWPQTRSRCPARRASRGTPAPDRQMRRSRAMWGGMGHSERGGSGTVEAAVVTRVRAKPAAGGGCR